MYNDLLDHKIAVPMCHKLKHMNRHRGQMNKNAQSGFYQLEAQNRNNEVSVQIPE